MLSTIGTRITCILILLVVFLQNRAVFGAEFWNKRQGPNSTEVVDPDPGNMTMPEPAVNMTTPAPPGNMTTPIPPGNMTTPILPGNMTTPILPGNMTTPILPGNMTTPILPGNMTTPIPPGNMTTPILPGNMTTPAPPGTTPLTTPLEPNSPAPNGTENHEEEVKKIVMQLMNVSHSTNEGDKCRLEDEQHITKAIEEIKNKEYFAAEITLKLVVAEFNQAQQSQPPRPFHLCDRTLFHTCHHTKLTCGCGEKVDELSPSAGQKFSTGHRYMWKQKIKSYYCYPTAGPCNTDPAITVMSIFEEEHQMVRDHYGTQTNITGNTTDPENCLKNYCAETSTDYTSCKDDSNKEKYDQQPGNNRNSNLRGRNYNGNNNNRQGNRNEIANNPRPYKDYLLNQQARNGNNPNGNQGGYPNSNMGHQRGGNMNRDMNGLGGIPTKMNQRSGNPIRQPGRNPGEQGGYGQNNQNGQPRGYPYNNIERQGGYPSNSNNMNQQENRMNDFIL